MHYQPVTDQIVRAHPLDPLSAIAFVLLFAVVALLTAYRPAFGVCSLIAGVPFAFYRDILGTTITLPKVLLLGIILGLTAHGARLREIPFGPVRAIAITAGLVLAATILSIAQAGSHGAAIREVLKVAEYGLAFLTAYCCYRLDPDERLLRSVIAVVVTLVCLGALVQEFGDAPSGMWFNNVVIPRIAGTLEGPNQLAAFLEIAIAALAAFACARPRPGILVALGVAAFSDVLTFSRSGLIAGAIALVVIAIVYRRAALPLIAPTMTAALAGIAVVFGWAGSAHVTATSLMRIGNNVGAATTYAGGVGSRAELWHAAIRLWRAHPIWGIGAGNFELDLPQAGLTGVRTHANSLYLQALAEGGIPLFLATVALVIASISSFVRRAKASPFIAAALAASIALAFHQTLDYVIFYPKVGEFWWIIMALGAACL